MRKLLLQLDSSRLASVFDKIVAYDAGADQVLSYGGVAPEDVRDLVHGCIFTRGPKDLHNTAVWIGGNNMSQGEQLLAMAQDALFKPFTVSIMLDSNGSNTTAAAAVVKIEQAMDTVKGKRVVVVAGTGPVGQRVAGLLGKGGAKVKAKIETLTPVYGLAISASDRKDEVKLDQASGDGPGIIPVDAVDDDFAPRNDALLTEDALDLRRVDAGEPRARERDGARDMATARLVGQAPAVVPGQRPGVDDRQSRVGQAVAELGGRNGRPVSWIGPLRFGHLVFPFLVV